MIHRATHKLRAWCVCVYDNESTQKSIAMSIETVRQASSSSSSSSCLCPVAAEPGAIIGDLKSQASMTNDKLHAALSFTCIVAQPKARQRSRASAGRRFPTLPSESRTHAMREPIRRVFVQLRAWRPCVPESCNPKALKTICRSPEPRKALDQTAVDQPTLWLQ